MFCDETRGTHECARNGPDPGYARYSGYSGMENGSHPSSLILWVPASGEGSGPYPVHWYSRHWYVGVAMVFIQRY